MPPTESETHEYIVVHDGVPTDGDGANRRELSSPSAHSSPVTDRDPSSPYRRRSGRPGDSLDRLRAAPALREIPWYPGKELPPERSIESTRVQTRGACLLATRGEVKDPPCSHCATGVGRFSLCISSDEWFHGACATCQLATRGNLCTFRKKDTLSTPLSPSVSRIKPEAKETQQDTDALHSIPSRDTPPPQIGPTLETRPRRPANQVRSETEQPSKVQESKKRKRETLQETTAWKPYVSPYLPSVPNIPLNQIHNSLPNTPILNPSPAPSYPQPPSSIQNEPSPLMNYIYQKENPENGIKRPLVPIKPYPSKPVALQLNQNTSYRFGADLDRNGSRGREPTDSLSPSAQLLQSFPPMAEEKVPPPPSPNVTGFVPTNADPRNGARPDPPLIDTLPRKKQKQIYGILGGIQSGIRSCKLQAESMQKQLDLLQAALGIDTEDGDEVAG